jgi:hypothetical protein
MTDEIAEIKREHFDAISSREVILVVKSDYGWNVEHWFPDGVAPTSSYDIAQEAAARALQLMKLKEPITPQAWPEIAEIGSSGGPPPAPSEKSI